MHAVVPAANRPAPINTFQRYRQLRSRQRHATAGCLWLDEAHLFLPFANLQKRHKPSSSHHNNLIRSPIRPQKSARRTDLLQVELAPRPYSSKPRRIFLAAAAIQITSSFLILLPPSKDQVGIDVMLTSAQGHGGARLESGPDDLAFERWRDVEGGGFD